MVMKRNEEISIKAGCAVEKMALDLLERKSTESILVEFNTPTHAFRVSPISVTEKHVPEQTNKTIYRAKHWPQLYRAGKMSLREAAQHRATNYALWQMDNPIPDAPEKETRAAQWEKPCPYKFDFAEIEKRVLAGISTVCIDGSEISAAAWLAMAPDELVNPTRAVVVPPIDEGIKRQVVRLGASSEDLVLIAKLCKRLEQIQKHTAQAIDDDKLAAAHKVAVDSGIVANADEPPKCSEKPIYYFASNDYKAVQAWAEKHGLPDWNRAKAGFDYPPNAVVVVSFYWRGGDTYEMTEAVADATLRGVPIEPLNRVQDRLHAVSFPEFQEKFLGYVARAFGIRPELLI